MPITRSQSNMNQEKAKQTMRPVLLHRPTLPRSLRVQNTADMIFRRDELDARWKKLIISGKASLPSFCQGKAMSNSASPADNPSRRVSWAHNLEKEPTPSQTNTEKENQSKKVARSGLNYTRLHFRGEFFQVGQIVFVLDEFKSNKTGKMLARWRRAEIIRITSSSDLEVNFVGWRECWNKKIDLERHLNTKVVLSEYDVFKLGKFVMADGKFVKDAGSISSPVESNEVNVPEVGTPEQLKQLIDCLQNTRNTLDCQIDQLKKLLHQLEENLLDEVESGEED